MRAWQGLAVAALLAQTAIGFSAEPQPPQMTDSGLVRVDNAKVALAYVRPGTDWSKYRTILLEPLAVPVKVRDAAPSGATTRLGESYVLRDQDVAALQKAYGESMRKALGDGGRYVFVTTAQADTLIVAVQVIDIKLAAPIEGSRVGNAGRSRTYSRGGGSIAIAAVLADGASGQVVGEAADRKYPADIWGINNSVTNLSQARTMFLSWGRALRNKLDSSGAAPATR